MSDDLNYENDLAIDPLTLDEDFLHQPGLYMKYSMMAANAEMRRDKAETTLGVVKAELDREIRKNPANYGADKITESVVSNTILLQPEYKKASDALIEATFELRILQSAVRAFDHRKTALENEVRLWLGSYFSGPKEPHDIPGGKRIVDIARDRTVSKVREEMNKPKAKESDACTTPIPVRRRS